MTAYIDKVVADAVNFWETCKLPNGQIREESEVQKVYDSIDVKYKILLYTFPIIVKHMIELNMFNENVFRNYLISYSKSKIPDTEEDKIRSQAKYLVKLYKVYYTNIDKKKSTELYNSIVDSMLQDLKKAKDETQKYIDAQKTRIDDKRNEINKIFS